MAVAAETAAVATAAASAAFRYNRENYMFDQGLRWGRFTTGYSMAMAQASMYREDIRDLTALTVTKQDTYHTVGVIFFVLNFQLIMAGRLGVHGPSPPGWLLGLYWTNICAALTFLVTFTWMAMHASARATAGGAFMLTRHVRLPIPTPQMLDKARKTGNSFEKQRVTDVFRIPFITPAPQEAEEDPETGRKVPKSDRRMPKWHQDETKELQKDEGGAAPGPNNNPEHFELYRGLQDEWWAHDVYSRIGVLYFMSHWLTAASLYSMCHIFTELRCIWPAYTTASCFVAAHYGVLSLDIVNKPRENSIMLPVEKVIPFVPFFCVVGMTVDYSVLPVSPVWQGFVYFLSWICYIIQFAWALRLYDLAAPQVQMEERPEQAGKPWWPEHWPLPPAFEDALYMVSAPTKLDSSMPCIQKEMKAAKGKKRYEVDPVKAKRAQPPMFPWKLFRGALITTIGMWVLIMVGRVFEQVNGERWLLKQEGRVERWPSHMQPWMAPWSRKGSRNEFCHAGGCDRRLSGEEMQSQQEIAALAKRLASSLGPVAAALGAEGALGAATTTPSPPAQRPVAPRATEVAWPADFRPAHLASSGDMVAAIDAAGRQGTLLRLVEGSETVHEVLPFMLEGAESIGEVLGAVWGHSGLVLSTATGLLAECPGAPSAGAWRCAPLAAPMLPQGLQSAVVTRHPATPGRLRAAVKFDGESAIVLLEAEAAHDAEWVPAGEAHAPAGASVAAHLSMSAAADELIVASADGLVVRRPLEGRAEVASSRLASAHSAPVFRSACALSDGRLAHLAAPRHGGAAPAQLFFSGGAAPHTA